MPMWQGCGLWPAAVGRVAQLALGAASGWQRGQVFVQRLITLSLYIVTKETDRESVQWRKPREELTPGSSCAVT